MSSIFFRTFVILFGNWEVQPMRQNIPTRGISKTMHEESELHRRVKDDDQDVTNSATVIWVKKQRSTCSVSII